jgi:hypothetical protein
MLFIYMGFSAALNFVRSTTKNDLQDPRTVFDGDGTLVNAVLAVEVQGYVITKTVSVDGAGTRTVSNTGLAADGAVALITTSVTSADGKISTELLDLDGKKDAKGNTSTDPKKSTQALAQGRSISMRWVAAECVRLRMIIWSKLCG